MVRLGQLTHRPRLLSTAPVESAISSEMSRTRIFSSIETRFHRVLRRPRRNGTCASCTKKVSSGLCITAPGGRVDDFHHVEGLDLFL